MTEFGPLVVLVVIWLLIGLPLSRAAKQKSRGPRTPGAPSVGPEAEAPAADPGEGPDPRRDYVPIQPTVSLSRQDDSLYRGSLNAETGEGYDPCHDEQMETLTRISSEPVPRPAPPAPALELGWTANDVVRGVVMSEILARKKGPYRS